MRLYVKIERCRGASQVDVSLDMKHTLDLFQMYVIYDKLGRVTCRSLLAGVTWQRDDLLDEIDIRS